MLAPCPAHPIHYHGLHNTFLSSCLEMLIFACLNNTLPEPICDGCQPVWRGVGGAAALRPLRWRSGACKVCGRLSRGYSFGACTSACAQASASRYAPCACCAAFLDCVKYVSGTIVIVIVFFAKQNNRKSVITHEFALRKTSLQQT
jgi:hypothetical protein